MKRKHSRVVSLLAVLVIAASLLAAAPAAVTASDHVTTLAGDDDDEVDPFNADEDEELEYTLDAEGADFDADGTEEVYINISFDDVDHFEYDAEVDGADEDYTFEIEHDELETLPGEVDETTATNVTAWGEDDDGDVATGAEEFGVDFVFGDERSVIYLEDGTSDFDDIETEEEEVGLLGQAASAVTFWSDDDDDDDTDIHSLDTDVGIAGNETDVHIFMEEDDAVDAFDDSAEAFDADGTPLLGQTVVMDGEIVPLYYGEAADWQDENSTHVTYEDGHAVVDVGEDRDDDDETSVTYGSTNALGQVFEDDDYDVIDDVQDAYGEDDLTVGDLLDEYSRTDVGILTWLASFTGSVVVAGASLFAIGAVGPARRESTA